MKIEVTDDEGRKFDILIPTPQRLLESIESHKQAMEHLVSMTGLAKQWERFSGSVGSTTVEIECAEDFLKANGYMEDDE